MIRVPGILHHTEGVVLTSRGIRFWPKNRRIYCGFHRHRLGYVYVGAVSAIAPAALRAATSHAPLPWAICATSYVIHPVFDGRSCKS